MHKMNGFTLVEFEIALIIAIVIALIVGVFGDISLGSSNRARYEADVFSDLRYSLETIQHKVRGAQSLGVGCPGGLNVPCLIVDGTIYFGVKAGVGLVCRENADNILFMTGAGDNIVLAVPTVAADHVVVNLSGQRNNVVFDIPNTIKRRPI